MGVGEDGRTEDEAGPGQLGDRPEDCPKAQQEGIDGVADVAKVATTQCQGALPSCLLEGPDVSRATVGQGQFQHQFPIRSPHQGPPGPPGPPGLSPQQSAVFREQQHAAMQLAQHPGNQQYRGPHHHPPPYYPNNVNYPISSFAPCFPPNYPSGPQGFGGPGQGMGQYSLRARRRVRQRVDAGEPRNSYSSIPGFSFRQQSLESSGGGGFHKGGYGMRGRGRGQVGPGGASFPPFPHLPPFPRYPRHPSLVQQHHHHQPHPPFPVAAAAAVHRALFLGVGAGGGARSPVAVVRPPPPGDHAKTVRGCLLRDVPSGKEDHGLPPLHSTPPSTPPTLVDSELIKVKSSECLSDPPPPHSSAENNQQPNNPATEKNEESNRDCNKNISENALLIREIISSKLTDMMEQGLGLVAQGPRDFSQHMPAINNNEFVKENQHAALISHMLKMQALNMSKDSDSDRHTESPTHSEDDKEEPINLEHNGRSSGSDGETSPASPSSDAGCSTSSAKDQKASRLENIVGSLGRSTSSPLPAQGANKRKLYQPVRETTDLEETKEVVEEEEEEPEQKRMKDGIENHIKSMQDQFVRLQEKFHNHNDENADPETSELHIDTSRMEDNRKAQREEVTIERRVNPKSFRELSGHPLLNGKADPLPLPPTSLNPNYMDLAKRFLQEQQDKVTKEMIMKDIVQSSLARNEIADKLAAISPELDGLADILHSELNTGLTIIVESIVQRFLSSKRQPLGKFSEDMFNHQDRHKTPSGRAPQVRDRSTPRTVANPLSMANPISQNTTPNVSNSLVMTSIASQGPPRMIPFPASLTGDKVAQMPSLYPLPNNNGQLSEDEREEESEQDDALNLVVTPKKHKRHKVTDTRITPRTVSRLLGDQPSMAELQKHFGPTSPFMPPGFPLPKLLEDMPRPPFHHLPFPSIPTSAGHPGLPQQFPFSPFGFPGPLGRPRDFSPPQEQRPRSASPPRDHRPPPPLLHPAILAAQSPDFAHMKHDREHDRPVSETSSDDLTKFDSKFDRMDFGQSPFSMASMSGKKPLCHFRQNAPPRQSDLLHSPPPAPAFRFHFKARWSHSPPFTLSWLSVSISWLGRQTVLRSKSERGQLNQNCQGGAGFKSKLRTSRKFPFFLPQSVKLLLACCKDNAKIKQHLTVC